MDVGETADPQPHQLLGPNVLLSILLLMLYVISAVFRLAVNRHARWGRKIFRERGQWPVDQFVQAVGSNQPKRRLNGPLAVQAQEAEGGSGAKHTSPVTSPVGQVLGGSYAHMRFAQTCPFAHCSTQCK